MITKEKLIEAIGKAGQRGYDYITFDDLIAIVNALPDEVEI